MLQRVPVADPAAEVAAWWRLVELCLPSHEECGALTFAPSGGETLEEEWALWVGGIFHPVLRPSLPVLQSAAAAQDAVGLLAAEAGLGAALPPPAARRSLSAGRHLLLSFRPPQGARLLERLRETASAREDSGHIAAVFAARGHAFHLPFVQVAGALLLAECVLGAAQAGTALPADRAVEFLRTAMDGPVAFPEVRLPAV